MKYFTYLLTLRILHCTDASNKNQNLSEAQHYELFDIITPGGPRKATLLSGL